MISIALLIKLLDFTEAMPFIRKLLQRNTQGTRTEAHPDTIGSAMLYVRFIISGISLP